MNAKDIDMGAEDIAKNVVNTELGGGNEPIIPDNISAAPETSEEAGMLGQVEGAAREAQGAGVPGAGMVARGAKVAGAAAGAGAPGSNLKEVKGAVAGLAVDVFADPSGETGNRVEGMVDGVSKGEAQAAGGNDLLKGSRKDGVEPKSEAVSPSMLSSLAPSTGGRAAHPELGMAL